MADIYRVIITDRAFADLDDVLTYIAGRSPQNAAEMIDRLLLSIGRLDFMPRRFAVVDLDLATGQEVRSMLVKPYLVRYRIDETARVVYVLAVRHGARQSP